MTPTASGSDMVGVMKEGAKDHWGVHFLLSPPPTQAI